MVEDLVRILRIPTRFKETYAAVRRLQQQQQTEGASEEGDDADEDVSLVASSSAVNNDMATSSNASCDHKKGGGLKKRAASVEETSKQGGWQKVVRDELDARGGFTPLMGLFNVNSSSSIDWHESDHELGRILKQMGREERRAK